MTTVPSSQGHCNAGGFYCYQAGSRLRGIVGSFKKFRCHPTTMGSHGGFEEDGNMIDNVARIILEAR